MNKFKYLFVVLFGLLLLPLAAMASRKGSGVSPAESHISSALTDVHERAILLTG